MAVLPRKYSRIGPDKPPAIDAGRAMYSKMLRLLQFARERRIPIGHEATALHNSCALLLHPDPISRRRRRDKPGE